MMGGAGSLKVTPGEGSAACPSEHSCLIQVQGRLYLQLVKPRDLGGQFAPAVREGLTCWGEPGNQCVQSSHTHGHTHSHLP